MISAELTFSELLIGILFLVVVITIAFFRTPKGKGVWGEFQVKIKLKIFFKKSGVIINNYVYVDENYKSAVDSKHIRTVQIDHIVVSEKGVLVVETKNYSGRIYGDKSQTMWTQVLKYGKVKNKLYNPIKQNETHCYYVRKIIGENVPIRSVVVFAQNNTEYIRCTGEVVGLKSLKKYLHSLPSLLNQEQVIEISEKLKSANQSDVISNRQHKKNVKNLLNDRNAGGCPYCGGALVYKKGQFGAFYGCSNYPKCTYKKKI